MNQGVWRALEDDIRMQAAAEGSVVVITGPIFCPGEDRVIGLGRVAVPCALFKIVIGQGITAVVVPNIAHRHASWRNFIVDVQEVERLAGFTLRSKP